MAKKVVKSKKRPATRSSSKVTKKRRVVKYTPPPKKKQVRRTVVKKKAAPKKRRLSQQELLAATLKLLKKDLNKTIRSEVRKAVGSQGTPKGKPVTPGKEAFPIEDDILFAELPKSQQEAMEMIAEMRREINQRNIMLDEMMQAEGKFS